MEASNADTFWGDIREQTHPFFAGAETLWRVSVPSTLPAFELHGKQLIEWGGALRWLRTSQAAQEVRAAAQQGGGHATLFRGASTGEVFTPLSAPLLTVHKRLKAHFDPAGIFNPGRLYREL